MSCASHERPRHRREGPPRRAAAEPLLPSPIGSSSRTAPACSRKRAGGDHGAGLQRSRLRNGLARARSPPHTARTASRRARRLAHGVTAAGSESPSEGAPTGGHARSAAHAHTMPEHRQRARASRTQAADTLRPIPAPDWCVGSAQRRTGTSLRAAEGARGATRRELGRRPTAPEDHGARAAHRGGCPGPRDELSEWRAPRRKKRRDGCRAAAGRRPKHRAASLSIARRLGSHGRDA